MISPPCLTTVVMGVVEVVTGVVVMGVEVEECNITVTRWFTSLKEPSSTLDITLMGARSNMVARSAMEVIWSILDIINMMDSINIRDHTPIMDPTNMKEVIIILDHTSIQVRIMTPFC